MMMTSQNQFYSTATAGAHKEIEFFSTCDDHHVDQNSEVDGRRTTRAEFLIGPFEAAAPRESHSSKRRQRAVVLAGLGISAVALATWSSCANRSRYTSELQTTSNILGDAQGWPVRAKHELRGPFPRIGIYGEVPRVDANIIDDREDPQTAVSCEEDPIQVSCTGGFGGGPKSDRQSHLRSALGESPEQSGPTVLPGDLKCVLFHLCVCADNVQVQSVFISQRAENVRA
jgi:hypothetical protein